MEERLGRLLGITGKVVREHFDQDLATIGSSLNTYIILRTVQSNPGVSQRQLAAYLSIVGPTLTHHLDRLEADGLLVRVRDSADRRAQNVELTGAGTAHLERVESHAAEADRALRSLFTASEVATLVELLNRIRSHYCKESDVRPAR